MDDRGKSTEQLLEELAAARQRVAELEGAVEALRRSEAMHLAMMDAIDDAIHVNDAERRYLAANAEMAFRVGMSKEALIGKTPLDIYDDLDLARRAMEHYDRVMRTGEVMDAETDFPGKKAPHRHVHRAPIRNEAGEIVGAVTVSRDITARRQADEALKRERDFTSAVIDTIGSLVVVLDRQAHIVRINRAFERVTGYTLEEAKGKPFWKVFPSSEATQGRSAFDKTLSGQFPNSDENYLTTRNGSQRLIAWTNTALLDPSSSVEHVISAGSDITEQRRAEDALQQNNARLVRWVSELE